MIGSWWFVWMLVMFLLLVPPMGYGWGYRGWGPPYPRYIQRRRGQRAVATGASVQFNRNEVTLHVRRNDVFDQNECLCGSNGRANCDRNVTIQTDREMGFRCAPMKL